MGIGVGLYGYNGGHQIHRILEGHSNAKLVATADFNIGLLSQKQKEDPTIKHYSSLNEMLEDDRVELVSICSPIRRNQAKEAIQIMKQGRHVYAEKPCAMTEEDLDAIINVSQETGSFFREMAGTAFQQPFLSVRNIVLSGQIGKVVQVFVQKSYPYHEGRPQDEDIDGGLIGQNAIHAIRLVEHAACTKINDIYAVETKLGNPCSNGELRMATSLIGVLENGGVASIIANYLNYKGFGSWGNEHLRIFGTKGFIEVVDGGARRRLVIGDNDKGTFSLIGEETDYFDMYINSIIGKEEMPISLEDELHCTRIVIKAKKQAIQIN